MQTKYPYQLQTKEAREKARISILNSYKTGKRKPVFLGEKRPEFSILIKNQYRDGQRKPVTMKGSTNPSWKGGQIEKSCFRCGNKFKIYPYRIKQNARFCSRKCANNITLNMKGRCTGKFFDCEICSKKFYRYDSLINQGVTRFCSSKCWGDYLAILYLDETKHPSWQGGKTSEANRIRSSREYIRWRKMVFERDSYSCRKCGDDRGGNLEAHHKKTFSLFPELRFDINNGITLCEKCHRETPTYFKSFGKDFLTNLSKSEKLFLFN